MQKRHRIFIAINLPAEIKKALASYQKKWQDLPANWVKVDNLHVTMVFLGYITEEELGQVCMVAKKVSQNYKTTNLSLNKIIYGPPQKSLASLPRMVWLTGEKSKELSSLKREIENAISESVNFKPENRGFSPHITLARINQMEFRNLDLEERPEINENIDLNFEVESIDVMESVLTKSGPEYTIIESFGLAVDN